MTENPAHIAFVSIELHIPHAQSLKQKRAVTRSLIERIQSRFNASVAELAYLDQWQRSLIGISMISNSKSGPEKAYAAIMQMMAENGDINITDTSIEWF